jgi:ubiquinone/menaquinone biosynthesis C-methylase UbiE
VLLADEQPPFDLGDLRVTILKDQWEKDPTTIIEDLVRNMKDRLESGAEGGDLYPIAEIEVDQRPVPAERKRHHVAAASEATAELFGLRRDILVGMGPDDLITHLGEIMGDSKQFEAFNAEQSVLYGQLSNINDGMPARREASRINATVPMTFFSHSNSKFNGRAFLPCVISQSQRPGISSTQRVVYVEVTHAVHLGSFGDYKNVYVCDLRRGNGRMAFDLYAKSYDRILGLLPNYKDVRDRHVKMIIDHCNGKAAKVLDVGAGTGNVTIPLLKNGLEVFAVDLNQAMLDRLSTKVTDDVKDLLHKLTQDCRSLRNFDDGYFDAVTMSLVLFAMGSKESAREALEEAVRVLKPGGLLLVTEPTRNFSLEPLLQQAENELSARPDWKTLERDWAIVRQANRIINPERSEFLPAEDIRQIVGKYFENFEERDAYAGNCNTIIGKKTHESP